MNQFIVHAPLIINITDKNINVLRNFKKVMKIGIFYLLFLTDKKTNVQVLAF